MELKINLKKERQNTEINPEKLDFGRIFTDHMFEMYYTPEKGWHNAQIVPFHNFDLSPATMVFHYAQSVFEGLKAYKYKGKYIALMRPEENFKRLNRSARRLVIPEIDEEFVLNALIELLKIEKNWIPDKKGYALYIRPTIIGTDPVIRLKPSENYLFYIILSPVGPYYKNGFKPAKILVETEYVRSVRGQTGDTKASANYGISLIAGKKATELGYDQALWLDAIERRYIEEVGSMNIFFVIDGKIVTPKLRGSILPGITRDSIIKLAKHLGYEVEERDITIDEVIEGIEKGKVTECFGTGTAAVISPVGVLGYKGKNYIIGNGEIGPISKRLFDEYTGIQYGEKEDVFGWLKIIEY